MQKRRSQKNARNGWLLTVQSHMKQNGLHQIGHKPNSNLELQWVAKKKKWTTKRIQGIVWCNKRIHSSLKWPPWKPWHATLLLFFFFLVNSAFWSCSKISERAISTHRCVAVVHLSFSAHKLNENKEKKKKQPKQTWIKNGERKAKTKTKNC